MMEAPVETARARSTDLPFDSVICFGSVDWWYHNRGHFDLQIMRELSRQVPVLYVNSIGMRFPNPREGATFLTRIRRKLASMRRGVVRVRERFHVYSPLNVPGRLAQRLSTPLLAAQTRRAGRTLRFRRPLLWISSPVAAEMLGRLGEVGVVYCRTDRYEAFPGVDPERISGYDRLLKRRADLTVFCASALLEAERAECRNAAFVDHGVDFEKFAKGAEQPEPEDLRALPRPRVGFIGSIDEHTFDPALFARVVDLLPDLQFVLVGATTLPDGWLVRPNVAFLGQKPYEQVAAYPGHCDVLIMPWNQSPWIQACNPIKLKEYLAAGRPVVTTWFEELRRYAGSVRVARGAEEFAAAIRAACAETGRDAERLRDRVRHETWSHQAERALALILAALARPADSLACPADSLARPAGS
jgi:glycosyltransferase involved in cell wall biosynthesis